MRVGEMCQKKPCRVLKIKDTVYGKGYTEYALLRTVFPKDAQAYAVQVRSLHSLAFTELRCILGILEDDE